MSFTLPSFAKINLYLEVLGKRSDGYHDICTVFQSVSLCDKLTFEAADALRMTCDDPGIPVDVSNLILKAAVAIKERKKIGPGAAIHLEKRIPSPGGLGGGSSNAAVALIGLCRLWNIHLVLDELHEIASNLGADVPFFLHGGTAIGTGRGTEITAVPDFAEENILIVTPDIAVSTREAFAGIEQTPTSADGQPNLTRDSTESILNNCRFAAESLDLTKAALKNDFEATVFAAYPEILCVKQSLLDLGARRAMLSGSGASVFGIFDKEETRQATQKALEKNLNWRMFAVAAISRSQYREALGITY